MVINSYLFIFLVMQKKAITKMSWASKKKKHNCNCFPLPLLGGSPPFFAVCQAQSRVSNFKDLSIFVKVSRFFQLGIMDLHPDLLLVYEIPSVTGS